MELFDNTLLCIVHCASRVFISPLLVNLKDRLD
jgi:hypothetical protein